jgi:small-conductance mechanosensitive channel
MSMASIAQAAPQQSAADVPTSESAAVSAQKNEAKNNAGATAASVTTAAATSYAVLADILENEKSRNQLINELRTLAAADNKSDSKKNVQASSKKDAAKKEKNTEDESNVLFSRDIAHGIERFIGKISSDFSEAAETFHTLGKEDDTLVMSHSKWRSTLLNMTIVMAATIAAFFLFRWIAAQFFSRSNNWIVRQGQRDASATHADHSDHAAATPVPPHGRHVLQSGLYRKSVAIIGALIADIAAILLAAAVGYAIGLFAVGETEKIAPLESLFINTFAAVEIARALVRGVFAPRYPQLRLFSMDDDIASFWGGWLERLISLTGYGILVGVPLVAAILSPTIGHMLGILIMLGVYIYAIRVIWRNRSIVRERMERYADESLTAFFATLLRMLARVWHALAIIYFTVLLVVSQIAPRDALPFMAEATLQTLLAIGIGLLFSAIVTSALTHRITLSKGWRTRLPLLEARINSYIPPALKGLHMLTMAVVVLVVLDAWHAFNLADWIASDSGRGVILAVVHVAIILVVATVVWTTVVSIIEHRLSPAPGQGAPSEREKTLLSLFRNAALIAIVTLTILVVLSQIGINLAPLIAGAGVAGLAIGFGAQKLVQDVITGVFIQLENGMNQNDVVEVAGIFGTVEKITIRSVGIRTLDGGFHMIPFSSVDKVSNHTRDFSYHYGEYAITYRENVDDAVRQLENAFKELMEDSTLAPAVLEDISIPGVTSLHERGYNIRVLIKTAPGMQWPVQRAFNRLVKKHFDAAGIEMPYPHTVLHFNQTRDGAIPPLPVQQSGNLFDAPPSKG